MSRRRTLIFRNKQITLIYLFLAIATLAAFWQVNYCSFVGDDKSYVTENTHIMNGITWEAVRWAFTSIYANFWHPLTMISLLLDFQLFGLNPHGYHLTNLSFHIASTLLLFSVLHRMTKAPWKSAFVAALFAVHPLNVESVAWVAERKNVLSTFFWMLAMVAYASYAARPRLKTYLATLALFATGLMAKPMLVTFPFVMLLLDYWPLQRLGPDRVASETRAGLTKPVSIDFKTSNPRRKPPSRPAASDRNSAQPQHKYGCRGIRRLLIEKVPFFALIPAFSLLAYIAEGEVVNTSFPWNIKVSNALVSYFIYIGKMFWPSNLAVFYPHPGLWPFWQTAGAALLLVVITGTIVLIAKECPYLIIGWMWFLGTLVPVIGIVQISGFGRADRFTYIPMIGLFVMVAWGVPELLKGWRYRAEALVAASTLILSFLSIVTWTQVGYWRNDFTLYDHALEVTIHNWHIHACRGDAYAHAGNYDLAIKDYERAIEINPKDAVEAYRGRGMAYAKLGNYSQAIFDYNKIIEMRPKNAEAYNKRGMAYAGLDNYRQAILDYDRTIELIPGNADPYNNRGTAHYQLGDLRQAILDFDRAIEINPKHEAAYSNRGIVYASLGNNRKAISDYDKAIEINPRNAVAFYNRGLAYGKLGENRRAISDYDRATEINPKYADAYYDRGTTYFLLGNYGQALSDYDRAIQINPRHAEAYSNRGLANANLGNYWKAISDYDRAIEINADNGALYYNRGVAHAKLGHNSLATEDMKTAARLGSEEAKNLLRDQGINW